mmetsp:Transcript_131401/g.356813  ORF Transcript_131401/g.356813 Transcript_131401/m.356813 type:complete len:221 (-) Transcript_131401:53-715(-)
MALTATAFAFVSTCFCAAPAVGARAAGKGSPLDDVGSVLQNALISGASELPESGNARAIVEAIGDAPAAESPFLDVRIDPVPRPGLLACDRNYNASCPENFLNAPAPGAGGGPVCVASPEYAGPCADELLAPSAWSIKAKQRWSTQCQVFWPCKACPQQFQARCPQGWGAQTGARRCSAPAGYSGPCAGDADFSNFNDAMLEYWSFQCGAFWPCSTAAAQ